VVKKTRKRLEHSNGHGDSPTGSETSHRSNGCPNGLPNEAASNALCEAAKEIIEHPDPMALVEQASGYAGDPPPSELAYLAVTSRLLGRPQNVQFLALLARVTTVPTFPARFYRCSTSRLSVQ
jgi:hypothetical protein